MSRDEILRRLRALAPRLRDAYGVQRVRLFGSHARDEAGPDSDVDLIVDLTEPLGFAFFDMEAEIGQALGLRVDLTTAAGLHQLIRRDVLAQAIDV